MQSPTHHYINFMKSVNKIIVKNNLISDAQMETSCTALPNSCIDTGKMALNYYTQ